MRKRSGKEGDLTRKEILEGRNNFKEGKTFNVGKALYEGKFYKKENL